MHFKVLTPRCARQKRRVNPCVWINIFPAPRGIVSVYTNAKQKLCLNCGIRPHPRRAQRGKGRRQTLFSLLIKCLPRVGL